MQWLQLRNCRKESQNGKKLEVTPCCNTRSCGYRDVTATYIRMSKIPSRIYAKHQYKRVKEYGSTWQYTFQHKDYKVITERDILVHVHYITTGYKSENFNLYSKRCSWAEKKIPQLAGRFRNRRTRASQPAPRDKLDLRWRAPLQSKLQNLNMQVQGSQKLPNK